MVTMTKRVNVRTTVAVRNINPPIYGTCNNIIMTTGDILKCLCRRAQVEEILPDGSIVKLNMSNYFTDNGAGLSASAAEKKPVKAVEQPIVEETPVEESAVEDVINEEEVVEDTVVEETPVEETVAEKETIEEVEPEVAITDEIPVEDVVNEEEVVEEKKETTTKRSTSSRKKKSSK